MLSRIAPVSERVLLNPQPPPRDGGAAAGPPAPPAGLDPFRQYELYHLAKISDRLETIVAFLALITVATFFTALFLFLRR